MTASFAHLTDIPQHLNRRVRYLGVILFVTFVTLPLMVIARTPPPSQEIEAAQAAVARAERADADQYAAESLLRARTALMQAQVALTAKKNADAEGLARLAAAEADFAYARSIETTYKAELASRRAEIDDLRRRLGVDGSP